jgi:prepilin-type N-terminal cleavage/methylation domain-containing protein
MAMTDSAQAGFSLIETLVALVLLAIGVVATTRGFMEGTRVSIEVDRRQRAIWLAHDKLAEKLAQSYGAVRLPSRVAERLEGGVLIGEDMTDGISRIWVAEPDYPVPGVSRVWVAARWERRGVVQTHQLTGLVAEGLVP